MEISSNWSKPITLTDGTSKNLIYHFALDNVPKEAGCYVFYNKHGNSLRFYRHQDIHKIEKIHIPNRVSEVRYKSDLTDTKAIEISSINTNGSLFEWI